MAIGLSLWSDPRPFNNTHFSKMAGGMFAGRAMLEAEIEENEAWVDLNWHWCPGLNPFSWCVNLGGGTVNGEGKVSLALEGLEIHDLQLALSADSVKFKPLTTRLVSADLALDDAIISYGTWLPVQMQGRALINRLQVGNAELLAVPVRISSLEKGAARVMQFSTDSPQIQGKVELDSAGLYQINLNVAQGAFGETPWIGQNAFTLNQQGRLKAFN
ncbi:hypothetical protein ACQUQP_12130 [Marinobacterium sp. YM272]|uniref:hypothetical protein n=1 Tax=Marinobacterium sp. YM272 TaxID=3421654 RepID=UPI003D7FF8D8